MNKWWLAATALLLFVSCAADAKKKWKADDDFEFEEVRTSIISCFYVVVGVMVIIITHAVSLIVNWGLR